MIRYSSFRRSLTLSDRCNGQTAKRVQLLVGQGVVMLPQVGTQNTAAAHLMNHSEKAGQIKHLVN